MALRPAPKAIWSEEAPTSMFRMLLAPNVNTLAPAEVLLMVRVLIDPSTVLKVPWPVVVPLPPLTTRDAAPLLPTRKLPFTSKVAFCELKNVDGPKVWLANAAPVETLTWPLPIEEFAIVVPSNITVPESIFVFWL